MIIYFGHRAQTSSTIAISQNELVDMETSGAKNSIRIVGNPQYPTTCQCGDATLVDGNFPPIQSKNGTRLLCDGIGGSAADSSGVNIGFAISIDVNSVCKFYRSTMMCFNPRSPTAPSGNSFCLEGTLHGFDSHIVGGAT